MFRILSTMLVLSVSAALGAQSVVESWSLPTVWTGEQGNPLVLDGGAGWQLDQIHHEDFADPTRYTTMPWVPWRDRHAWFVEAGSEGGQPVAFVDHGVLTIEVRDRKDHSRYPKSAAIGFTAPRDGVYRLHATTDAQRWEGGASLVIDAFRGYTNHAGDPDLVPAGGVGIPIAKGHELVTPPVELAAGERYLATVSLTGYHSGATVRFHQLRAERLDAMPEREPPRMVRVDGRFAGDFRPRTAGDRPLPTGTGVYDVQAHYGATGDGTTDDTAAIQRAIDEALNTHRVLYFPPGTYRVTGGLSYGGTLERVKFVTLQGAGRERTRIVLADGAAGFGDAGKPRALLNMWDSGDITGQAFNNCLYDLTLDTGSGNPGAVALRWMSHNIGTLENVTLRSGDGAGVCGLDLTAREPGPSFVRGLVVEGFDVGVRSNQTAFSMTFEDLRLSGQRVAGMVAEAQCYFVRRLDAELAVPAIHNKGPWSSVFLYDSELRGSGPAAILSDNPQLVLGDVRQRGYAALVDCTYDGGPDLAADATGHWSPSTGAQISAFGDTPGPLDLPVEEIPDIPWGAPGDWEVVDGDALLATYDDAELIQAAIDRAARRGRHTVCIPNLPGTAVRFGRTVRVHGSVRRLIGMHTWMQTTSWFSHQDQPVFRIEDGDGPVSLERLYFADYGNQRHHAKHPMIEHASTRTLVLRNLGLMGHHPYVNTVTGGKVFIDDTTSQGWHFRDQQVWMRQFNPESNQVMATVEGGSLWVFGSKTECETGTWFKLTDGARMELLGGYNYPSWRNQHSPVPKPLFVVEGGSRLWASYREQIFHGYMDYPVQVRETRGGETRDLGHAARSGHHFYSVVQAGR